MLTHTHTIDLAAAKLEEFSTDYLDKYNISLLNGLSGLGVAASYLSRHHDARFQTMADRCYGEIRNRLRETTFKLPSLHSYCSGLSGVLFALNHLEEQGFYPNPLSQRSYDPLVDTFQTYCERDFKKGNVDFLHGPIGVFYSLLKRFPDPAAKRGLDAILNRYEADLVEDNRGIRITNTVVFDQHPLEYNLSLSHGLTGHVLIFCEALRAGYEPARMARLIRGIMRYISGLKRAHVEPGGVWYPSYYVEDAAHWRGEVADAFKTRLAWCYGDLNFAVAFIKAGTILGEADWSAEGYAIAENTLHRTDPDETQVHVNPYVCHGAAGLGYLYGTVYEHSGDYRYREAQQHWLGYTSELLAGRLGDYPPYNISLSLLEGLSGVALSMLSERSAATLPTAEFFLLNP